MQAAFFFLSLAVFFSSLISYFLKFGVGLLLTSDILKSDT